MGLSHGGGIDGGEGCWLTAQPVQRQEDRERVQEPFFAEVGTHMTLASLITFPQPLCTLLNSRRCFPFTY